MRSLVYLKLDKRLPLKAYIPIASRTMSLIAEAAEDIEEIDATLSVSDLPMLLNRICEHMSGEFAVHRSLSGHVQIIYEPHVLNETEFGVAYINTNFGETDDDSQNHLWISEKVLFAFMDRKLYGTAFILYIYLGYLMTCNKRFAVSHNISFEEIVARCRELPEDWRVKYQTTLMRALADLQDAGLVKWNTETGTFEVIHITPFDPDQKV